MSARELHVDDNTEDWLSNSPHETTVDTIPMLQGTRTAHINGSAFELDLTLSISPHVTSIGPIGARAATIEAGSSGGTTPCRRQISFTLVQAGEDAAKLFHNAERSLNVVFSR